MLWYAPDSAYGRPDDLKALIDEAHLRGLMVFLDVVYNHFGPEGNYLGRYAPAFFTEAQTPWGSAIDYRVPQVRAFAIENALYWLREYRFDGLRLDAVHTIAELGEISMLHDLSVAVGELAAETGRHIHLVLENDDNRASLLDPEQDPPRGKYRAQWNDDYHHAWHVLLTGETQGYYRDYQRSPLHDIARALGSGFVYQGEASAHRGGQLRGEPSGTLAPDRLRQFPAEPRPDRQPRARRPAREPSPSPDAIEAALAITLLAPMIPMLFMGEEWGSKAPFPFFCDFKGDLAEAVRKGRRREYAWAYAKYGDEVPDPLDAVDLSIRRARLAMRATQRRDESGWRWCANCSRSAGARSFPGLRARRFGDAQAADNGLLTANWRLGDGATLRLTANLSNAEIAGAARRDDRHPDLGRRDRRARCRHGRCSGVSERADASGHSDRDLSPATHGEFRFRRGRRHRPLSEGARHHAISMPRPS